MNTFDYIIIGAGSAGCVLANKLGAQSDLSILVVEAGPMDRNIMIHIPAGVYSAWRNPTLNWNYFTEAEPALHQRNIAMPRGKVVGGSSSINSMVYMRGHPFDYDRWADNHGLTQWRYSDCLPYFRAGEASDRGESEWRGSAGELGVSKGSYENPLYDVFLEAGKQSGQGYSDDLNAFQPEGIARFDATRRHGQRCSAAVAYLKPAIKRGNVTLLTNALVEKIILQKDTAVGIQVQHKGQQRTIYCSREVILSAGAINSPQMLMLSGIGPQTHLTEHGIKPIITLDGVGQNLQDHPSVIVQYACKKPLPIHSVNTLIGKIATGLRWMLTRKGLGASNIWEAGGFVRSSDSVEYADLQYHFGPVGFDYIDNKIEIQQGFAIHVDLLRPSSRGSITLQSANPAHKALMNFNYLDNQSDLNALSTGVEKVRDLISQSAFDPYRGAELEPGPSATTQKQLQDWIRNNCATDFHPCGSCRMGEDESCVVDAQMRVHGCNNLRVVDASVMPRVISGNLNAPTQMIAARAADYILRNRQRTPEHASFAFQND